MSDPSQENNTIFLRDLFFHDACLPMTVKMEGDTGTLTFRIKREVIEGILEKVEVGKTVNVKLNGDFLYLGIHESLDESMENRLP